MPVPAERRPLALVILPWLLLGLLDVYLAMGFEAPPSTARLLGELVLVAFLGIIVHLGLPSFPGAATTLPPLIPLLSLGASAMPRSVTAVFYLLGLLGTFGAIAVPLVKRRGPPWWLSCLLVAPSIAGTYALQGTRPVTEQLASDLTWPSQRTPLPAPTAAGPPVVVISVDTLRADVATTMRSYQRLAARGASWSNATSTSSWTLPALASLQTGVLPGEHGAGCLSGGHCQGIEDEVQTLAEGLAERGYANVGIVANPWASRENGVARGFHRYHALGTAQPRRLVLIGNPLPTHHQDAEVVLGLAESWLDTLVERGGSFYLWVHLLDPHLPYLHADYEPYRNLTAEVVRSTGILAHDDRRRLREAYEHEVAVMDERLERFLDRLESHGLFERAVVVFTSDHGEEFWEHGAFEHGHSHHREVVQIPLVVAAPGLRAGPRDGLASLVDVAPTLRALTGTATAAEGTDLRLPLPADRIVTTQGNLILWHGCSARDASMAVLVDDCGSEAERIRRYDLVSDPGERVPLLPDPEHPVHEAALDVRGVERGDAAEQDLEALKALGYVQ